MGFFRDVWGAISGSTARKAGEMQAAGYDRSREYLLKQAGIAREDLAPWRETGQTALQQYAALYGVGREGMLSEEEMEEARGRFQETPGYEFAFDEGRTLMLIDTFGTADEDRFWDLKEFEKGNYVEKSKEFVRGYYREIGYHDELYKARNEGLPEPEIR